MPKVISYTPSWLSRPSPGFRLFTSPQGKSLSGKVNGRSLTTSTNGSSSKKEYVGPSRLIARRGTEIFVVVDNTIRWSDLCMLKDAWEEREREDNGHQSSRRNEQDGEQDVEEGLKEDCYKVLKVPVHEQIRQLIPSPNGELLAIITSHTIHIAILPDSSHLTQPDSGPIRLKTHTLGPTTHVLSQSPIVTALWHPLGVGGDCIVTVTAEAVVRVWELDRGNRWSFDSPTLGVDLKKLAYGKSAEDDFSPIDLKANRGFSLDGLGMEVASACFGGTGSESESGWCPMTLWIAMMEGDVYALCPLLPSKWQPPSTLVPTLTTTIAAKAAIQEEELGSLEEHRQSDEQYQWLAAIDKQDPILVTEEFGTSTGVSIYDRPSSPGPIPRLQGPFRILPDEEEQDLEFASIHVIASKLDVEELMDEEDEYASSEEDEQEGLSASVICLMTTNGRLYICLDLDGVEAQWLPSKKAKLKYSPQEIPQPELVLLEALDTLRPEEVSDFEWPTFTPDISSRYSFFTTHSNGIFFFLLSPWIQNLEEELRNSSNIGTHFRLDILSKGSGTLRERILEIERSDEGSQEVVSACVVLQDSDLGYFLLTASGEQPQAVNLDAPDDSLLQETNSTSDLDLESDFKLLTMGPARTAYQPPESLWAESSLPSFLESNASGRHKKTLKEEIRLSSLTLGLMTEAHRILSAETHQLGIAAADLFRRCERLVDEFRDQIRRVRDTALRIDQMNDDDADDYEEKDTARGSARIEERLENVKATQGNILARHEALRKKLARACRRDLSEKEQALITEVDMLGRALLEPDNEEEKENGDRKQEPWRRHAEARKLADDLISHAKNIADEGQSKDGTNGAFKVPPDIRKVKVAQVMTLLDRESALVNAAHERLERLSLASVI